MMLTDEQRLILNNLRQILVVIGSDSDGLPDEYVAKLAALHCATLALFAEADKWFA